MNIYPFSHFNERDVEKCWINELLIEVLSYQTISVSPLKAHSVYRTVSVYRGRRFDSGTASTQPHEDNRVAIEREISNPIKKVGINILILDFKRNI